MNDAELRRAFDGAFLGAPEWTHRAHLRVAWLYLADQPLDAAHLVLRAGILRLNASHGLVESVSRGYHETLTRVWLTLVAAARQHDESADSLAFVDAHAGALHAGAPLRFYTRERLMSVRARACFLEPDLEPLPRASTHGPCECSNAAAQVRALELGELEPRVAIALRHHVGGCDACLARLERDALRRTHRVELLSSLTRVPCARDI